MNARKHNLSGIVAMAVFAVTLVVVQIATAQPQSLEGWPIDFEGWFAFDTSQWSGPVIADLDPSEANGKEVIFADTRRIFIYTASGGRRFNGTDN